MTTTWKSVRAALAASPLGPVWRHSKVAWRTRPLVRAIAEPQPKNPKGKVVLAALTSRGFDRVGKMTAREFLPVFCNRLRQLGYCTHIVTTNRALQRHRDGNVIHVYKEEKAQIPDTIVPGHNAPAIGRIIGSKHATHAVLSPHVPMPALADRETARTFSNHDAGSGEAVQLISAGEPLDDSRYNTEFVDTRVAWNGRDYYTSLRMLCIGPTVLKIFVRARDASEGNPSVHAKDTPVDAGLLNFLYDRIVRPNEGTLAEIAQKISDVLGPGFYAHDILPGRDGLFLCEVGFKFDDDSIAYYKHIRDIAEEIGMEDLEAGRMAVLSAEAFARQIDGFACEIGATVGRTVAEDFRRPALS